MAYDPWCQNGLIERIRALEWSWHQRPFPADPLSVARYGWRKISGETDMIECSSCKARLYLPWPSHHILPSPEEEDLKRNFERSVAEKYFKRLSEDGHGDESCPWRLKPSPRSLLCTQPLTKQEILANTEVRSVDISKSFPGLRVEISHDLELVLDALRRHSETSLNESCRIAAFLGWTSAKDRSLECVEGCKRKLILETCDFDPLEKHHWYCPIVFNDPTKPDSVSSWRERLRQLI